MGKIIIDGDISYWGYSGRWLRRELEGMKGDLEVTISSYGGDVFEGIDMFNALKRYETDGKGKVTTIVDAKAMSIASLIFLAGSTRKAYENSTIMIHKAWTWLAGNADDLQKEALVLDGIDMILVKEYSKYMPEDDDKIKSILSDEGWYIGRQQLEETNFVSEFIGSDDEVDTMAQANYRSAMASFSAKAQEHDIQPNIEQAKKAILDCNDGKCFLATMPSDNEKIVNSNKGADMEFTEENFNLLANQNKVYEARIKTLEARQANMEDEAKVAASALDTTKAELSKFEGIEAKLSEAEAKSADAETRVREAIACNVDADTAVAMLGADTAESASKLAIEFNSSEGATGNADDTSEDVDAKKEDAEMAIAMAMAEKLSV